MLPGTVIRWDNLPFPQYGGKLKPRWLICLGCTDCFSDPIVHFFHSTTTQLWPGPCHKLPKSKYRFFLDDCFVYFNERPYSFNKSELNIPAVSTMGNICEADLKNIYEGILYSRTYSKKVLLDIHRSLNKIGIIRLKKP